MTHQIFRRAGTADISQKFFYIKVEVDPLCYFRNIWIRASSLFGRAFDVGAGSARCCASWAAAQQWSMSAVSAYARPSPPPASPLASSADNSSRTAMSLAASSGAVSRAAASSASGGSAVRSAGASMALTPPLASHVAPHAPNGLHVSSDCFLYVTAARQQVYQLFLSYHNCL